MRIMELFRKKMVGALKAVGFDMVFDTSFGADLTSIYEARELDERLDNKKNLPMFSSCCPSWVSYANSYVPLLKKICLHVRVRLG